VTALQAFALQPPNAAVFVPFFGLVLSTLLEVGATSDTAISEWFEAAEEAAADGSGDGAVALRALLNEKWTKWLLEKLDEEDEDDDEDDDGEVEDDDEEAEE
jgi:hypothetical protein